MNAETLRQEIGIHRPHSNSSPAHTPLQAEDERCCSVARTFSYPRLGRVPEEPESVQNRMKARSPEGLLGLQTFPSIAGMLLRLPSTYTELTVLARHHSLCYSLTNHQVASL